eukprot:TRINITY_DN3309_c0_g1_i1.p1 TRINITY_DN3309_c0_g1~~TRINITY_DN3309_c0_g1_i1.p1  ORF type:complete len:123 (-),score=49.06 TRINITY_DN3309_c0_g1_i1:106-474(-)
MSNTGKNIILQQTASRQVLTTPKREALKLYRDVFRTAKKFRGLKTPTGEDMYTQIIKSARTEFEASKFETDPTTIARNLVVARDYLMNINYRISTPNISRKQHDELMKETSRDEDKNFVFKE